MIRLAAAMLAITATTASAAEPCAESCADRWPARALTIVVPYGSGGAPDLAARLVAGQLASRLGQSVVVEDHPGAGGMIGSAYAATAKPDGYTLLLGTIDTQAILGHFQGGAHRINPTTAFVPISLLGRADDVIAASPQLAITSFSSLLDAHKGRAFTFATPGVGTSFHILGEYIRWRESISLVHVPYRVASTGYGDVMAGRVDLVISGVAPVAPLLAAGKLVPLVTTGSKRSRDLPETPTLGELGFKDLVFANWFGLLAPAGTPQAVITLLNQKIAQINQVEEYRRRLEAALIEPLHSSPEEFGALIRADYARFGGLIARASINVN